MQGLTNVSMMYLNYPAKVLFKSSRMVPIMCFGVVCQVSPISRYLEFTAASVALEEHMWRRSCFDLLFVANDFSRARAAFGKSATIVTDNRPLVFFRQVTLQILPHFLMTHDVDVAERLIFLATCVRCGFE